MKPNATLPPLVALVIACLSCAPLNYCFAQSENIDQKDTPSLQSRESQLLELQTRLDEANSALISVQKVLGEQHEIVRNLREENEQFKEMLEAAKLSTTSKAVEQMLLFKPKNTDAVFDMPRYPLLLSVLRIKTTQGNRGFELSYQSQLLRRFLDTNDDEKLDLWIYYKDGVESYRESDKDNDSIMDSWQYTQGDSVRMLLDNDDDGDPDECYEGKLSDLRTLSSATAVQKKVLEKSQLPNPDWLLPAGVRKIEAAGAPKRFVASIGGFASQSFRIEFADGKLTYRQNANGFAEWGGTAEEIQVAPEAWIQFRDQLNEAEVWKWRRRYDDLKILDGMSWKFEIDYDEQSIASSGSNATPEQFKQFLDAVSDLSGKRPFK